MLIFDEPEVRDITFAKPDDGKSWSQVAREAVTNLGDLAERPQVYKRIFDASWQAQTYVENSNARQWAQAESVDRLISAVKSASGVKLDNPMQGGFEAEAETMARERLGDMYGAARARAPAILDPFRLQAFESRLQQLVDSDPKVADAVSVARIDFSPTMIARRAEMDLQAAYGEAGSGIAAAGAAIGGAVVPSFRDPINAAGLFFGAGPSAARTVAGRIFSVGAREALINAGITAVQQPFVQDFRREAGLEAGLGEAIKNIAMAFGVGGVLGGGVQGVRDLVGRAVRGEVPPAELRAAMERAGVALGPEEGAALRAAERVDVDDAAVLAGKPKDMPEVEAGEVLRQAVRYAEDPVNEPLPDLPIIVSSGSAAIERVDLAAKGLPPEVSLLDAAAILRGAPELVDESLPIDLPVVRQAVHIARLSDEAFAMVETGQVPLALAARVGAMVADPLQHAGAVAELMRFRPEGELEASRLISSFLREDVSYRAERSGQQLRPVETVEPGTPQALAAAERVELRDDATGDLFGDGLPLASLDDPSGTRIVSREAALAEAEKTGFAADLVAACKAGA